MDASDELLMRRLHWLALHVREDQPSNELLLLGDAADRVDDLEVEFLDDAIVLFEHLALEQSEALDGVAAPPEVHSRLVELELDASCHQPVQRYVDRHTEIQRQVGLYGKTVKLSQPLSVDASG